MLEHVPKAVGEALRGIGPGLDKLMINASFAAAPAGIVVTSPDFADGAGLPRDTTEDGRKLSPALAWRGVPDGAAEVVLVIEDADSPTPSPLVHAIVIGLPGRDGGLAAGDVKSPGSAGRDHRLGQKLLPQGRLPAARSADRPRAAPLRHPGLRPRPAAGPRR